MAQIAAERYTGASIKRSEDPRILTGRGRYVDDLKLPGMLHAAFVRSPLAHGRVLAVDVSAAQGAARSRPGAHRGGPGGGDGPRPGPAVRDDGRRRARARVHLAGDGQGAFRRRPGGDRDRREPLPGRGRLRAGRGRLRRPDPGRERGFRPRRRQSEAVRQPGRQHHRPAQAQRVRRRRRHVRGGGPDCRVPHRRAPPPERAHGGTRLRGELRRRFRRHDGARRDAGRSHDQDGRRHAPRHRAGQGACSGRRYRRLVRLEDRRLARGARRRRRVARSRQAGQVGRGPQREPRRVRAGARGGLRRPCCRQRRR